MKIILFASCWLRARWELTVYAAKTLCCTIFCSYSYAVDTALEPLFWLVDNFAKSLGPCFVAVVVLLTLIYVLVAHYIGVPYWWHRSPATLAIVLPTGYWLLVNVVFNYTMALLTSPGLAPRNVLLPETAGVCRKCVMARPPRTHHCSLCNRCILKMDHHCPWLNQCVGHFNHRFFLLYMVYMVLGTLLVMVFGFDIVCEEVLHEWWSSCGSITGRAVSSPQLEPVIWRHNNSTGDDNSVTTDLFLGRSALSWRRFFIVMESLLSIGVFVALAVLCTWHARLISRAETSIEAHINRRETLRLRQLSQVYKNPYDRGFWENWMIFLGLRRGRGWRHILLPSTHAPENDGLSWRHLLVDYCTDVKFL